MTATYVTGSEMKLGDVIEVFDGPFSTAIVKKIEGTEVTLYRPYGTHADFTCTSRVICYTGLEEYKVSTDSKFKYRLWQRANHLK